MIAIAFFIPVVIIGVYVLISSFLAVILMNFDH